MHEVEVVGRYRRRQPPGTFDAWSYDRQAHGLLSLKGWHEDTFAEAATALREARRIRPALSLADLQTLIGCRGTEAMRRLGLLAGIE